MPGEPPNNESNRSSERARRAAGGTAVAVALLATLLAACTHAPAGSPALITPTPNASAAVAAQYLLIAREGNRRLEIDFDGLEESDWGDLAEAKVALRDAAATERLFDRRLMAITFPPALGPVARELDAINQSRASLTMRAAGSTSVRELRRYESKLEAANEPVERAVRIIRSGLGLPPPETS